MSGGYLSMKIVLLICWSEVEESPSFRSVSPQI